MLITLLLHIGIMSNADRPVSISTTRLAKLMGEDREHDVAFPTIRRVFSLKDENKLAI